MKVEPIKSKDDIRNMLEILEYRNPRDKILFAIGIYTGLRISDILKLKVKDIYCKNRLEVKQQKTKEYVYIPINKELKKLIKEYVEDNNLAKNDYLIKSRQGYNKPITRERAYQILNEASRDIGLDMNIGTHTMRKTAGYNLYIASNKDVGLVMEILGQKDMASTLRYIGINNMDIDKCIRKLSYL
ncbi:MAG: tyrosine-type recombinase/integrase [Clostridium sp.]|uniref:tyrosine-type recombinase/integrase n=1 Tax=Clostridium sp. 2218st1_F5_2218SCRN_220325 TaxID=3143056 RepID=UPI00319DF0F9